MWISWEDTIPNNGDLALAVVPGKESVSVGGVPLQSGQLHSRLGVQDSSVISGVVPGSQGVPADNGSAGRMLCGPVCLTAQCPVAALHETPMQWRRMPCRSSGPRGEDMPSLHCLIGRCLKKVREEKASLILVAPVWRSQSWYPALLELLVDYPRILPEDPQLLMDPSNNPHPLVVAGQLRLAAWRLSSIVSKLQEFLKKLPNSSQQDGARVRTGHTKVLGKDGIAGVRSSKLILFLALFRTF